MRIEVGKRYEVLAYPINTKTGHMFVKGDVFQVVKITPTDYVKVKFREGEKEKITVFHIDKMDEASVIERGEAE